MDNLSQRKPLNDQTKLPICSLHTRLLFTGVSIAKLCTAVHKIEIKAISKTVYPFNLGRSTGEDSRSVLRVPGESQSHWRGKYFPRGSVSRSSVRLSHANYQPTRRSRWTTTGRD